MSETLLLVLAGVGRIHSFFVTEDRMDGRGGREGGIRSDFIELLFSVFIWLGSAYIGFWCLVE